MLQLFNVIGALIMAVFLAVALHQTIKHLDNINQRQQTYKCIQNHAVCLEMDR